MKSAIGGSMLFYLVLFFTITIILLFASILSYSKAYRVKNRIINILETTNIKVGDDVTNLQKKIDKELKQIGYKTTTKSVDCTKHCSGGASNIFDSSYKYCVCRHASKNNNGYYYEVITFNQFEFPVIGSIFASEVKGETKILGRVYE